MKILHVSEVLPGGVGSYIDDLAAAQARRSGQDQVMVLAPAAQLNALGKREAYRTTGYCQKRRGWRGLLTLRRAVRDQVKNFAPDVVHLHSSFAGAVGRLPGVISRRGPRPAIIYTAHGWSIDPDRASGVRARFAIAIERALATRCDRIVNISPHETNFLQEMGFPAAHMSVVATGLPLTPVFSEEWAETRGGLIRLLFAGRLAREKGFDLILPELRERASPPWRLRVAGIPASVDGDNPASAPPQVEMLGWLGREQVAEELAACDALIMPSRWEGLPIIALEAMRASKPVIANSIGPFPHMIDHGIDGLLADFAQPGALTRVLDGYDRPALAALGRRARARFERDYSQDAMVDAMFGVYRDVLSAASSRFDSRATDLSQE